MDIRDSEKGGLSDKKTTYWIQRTLHEWPKISGIITTQFIDETKSTFTPKAAVILKN